MYRSAQYNSVAIRDPRLTGINGGNDNDAAAFLLAAGIVDSRQQRAIFELTRLLKQYGLWSKMKAIYPFVGGTATSHKWNLKDPRDADAAFRLTFSGGWTHSSTGADPNGTTAYADTFLTPSSTLLQDSTHISFYSRENSTGTEVEMGVSNSTTQANRLFIEINTSGTTYISVNDTFSTTFVSFADTDARGYYIGTRISSNLKTAFRNNIVKGTSSAASDGLANWSVYIGAYHSTTGTPIQYYSTKQCAFATIGDGLTDAEATNLYYTVDIYQRILGRAV